MWLVTALELGLVSRDRKLGPIVFITHLQVLQPVFTFGLLARGFFALADPFEAMARTIRKHSLEGKTEEVLDCDQQR